MLLKVGEHVVLVSKRLDRGKTPSYSDPVPSYLQIMRWLSSAGYGFNVLKLLVKV